MVPIPEIYSIPPKGTYLLYTDITDAMHAHRHHLKYSSSTMIMHAYP